MNTRYIKKQTHDNIYFKKITKKFSIKINFFYRKSILMKINETSKRNCQLNKKNSLRPMSR